jgi:DNA-binding NarL/FixJ family response regulator
VYLAPRERDVVRLLALGFTNKEIAVRLRISLFTTKEYVSNVLQKTGLPNRAAVAMTYAMNLGLPGAHERSD